MVQTEKVTVRHLQRKAYLYVRQSTMRQVVENTESTERQYDLRRRAIQMGWAQEQVVVIDNDLGQSGASSRREGFQWLVAEVGLGRAGIVMGLEVSRLARNSADWHRLLELCALTQTLILDEDGLYDPAHFNDRLLLGLKGTMSEAELHMIKARLLGGLLNKARKGELVIRLPVGFVYDLKGRVVLDPDREVQESIHLFFATFLRTGAASATIKAFCDQNLAFPHRIQEGVNRTDLVWKPLLASRALAILHNPRYAGAFCYGRSRQRRGLDGRTIYTKLPRDEWTALVRDAHPGYISWEQFEGNLRRLRETSQAYGSEREKSPPREGPALLQGLVVCGRCGRRMTVSYYSIGNRLVPLYTCYEGIKHGRSACQRVLGAGIERAIGKLLVECVTPVTLEMSLAVGEELFRRREEAGELRRKHVERLRYEADLARHRYMLADPKNRLVADELEGDWNAKLRDYRDALEALQEKEAEAQRITAEQRARIMALAEDFPRIWNDPQTPNRERKRMVRLILEDVTVTKGSEITAQVRFKGGTTQTLVWPLPLSLGDLRRRPASLVAEVDRLLDDYTYGEIARILNSKDTLTADGKPLTGEHVRYLQQMYDLVPRYDRMRNRGMLTAEELAARLGIRPGTVRTWNKAGLLKAHRYNDRNGYLFEPPEEDVPARNKHKGLMAALYNRRLSRKDTFQVENEVQYGV